MRESEMKHIARWMDEAIANAGDDARLKKIAGEVAEMCRSFPAPGISV
jgi:glycine hydroxymethyltransferase